jgi:hypothetical protein
MAEYWKAGKPFIILHRGAMASTTPRHHPAWFLDRYKPDIGVVKFAQEHLWTYYEGNYKCIRCGILFYGTPIDLEEDSCNARIMKKALE